MGLASTGGRTTPALPGAYDAQRVASFAGLFHVHGTVLASWSLWFHLALYTAIAGACAAVVLLLAERPDLIEAGHVNEAVTYFSLLVAAALALYISTVLGRWWEVRNDMLGSLWCAIDDLMMSLAAHFPNKHRDLKHLVLRYCLLSVELLFMEARGGSLDDVDLGADLIEYQERKLLQPLAAKSQVVWVWIAALLQKAKALDELPPGLREQMQSSCHQARGAIGGLSAYLETQLPYAYVHLMSVIVHGNNLMVAIKCGVLAAGAISNLQRRETMEEPISDAENVQVLGVQLAAVIVIPLFNLALLELGVLLSEPLGAGADSPQEAFREWLREECQAFLLAADNAPDEIALVTCEAEIPRSLARPWTGPSLR